MKKIILFLFVLSISINAQVEGSRSYSAYTDAPAFNFEILKYKSTNNSLLVKLDIYLQMPYANIQFIKDGNSFIAKYHISIELYNSAKEKILYDEYWDEKITVSDFNKSLSRESFKISHKSLDIKPGEYYIKIQAEDLDSKKTFAIAKDFEVKNYSPQLEFSDILLISNKSTGNTNSLIPNISRTINNKSEDLEFIYEIYSPKEDAINLEYELVDNHREENHIQNRVVELKPGKNTIHHTMENINLALGDYDLVVKLLADEKAEIKNSKPFGVKLFGFPATIHDLDIAIEQMMYIASEEILDSLRELTDYNERLKGFISYWNFKDPSPNTIENEILFEYFRRVHYSNVHFRSYYDGWRTDMGMVYITLGPPHQVERHPFESDGRPYEIWQYQSINRTFLFIDQSGFGDYRLANANYGDLQRYRY